MPRITIQSAAASAWSRPSARPRRWARSAPRHWSGSAPPASAAAPPPCGRWPTPWSRPPSWPTTTTPTLTPSTSASEPNATSTPDPTTRRPPGPCTRRPLRVPGWGFGGGAPSPGVLATRIARGAVVPAGRAARPSRANVRYPAAAQLPTAQPFALDGQPGARPRRPRSVAGEGRAFGACCFAGKLRSPGGPDPVPPWPRPATPYADPYAELYADLYAGHPRTPSPVGSAVSAGRAPRGGLVGRKDRGRLAPLGGVERPRRVVRFARLIHRRGRAFWPAFVRRRLRRHQIPPRLLLTVVG